MTERIRSSTTTTGYQFSNTNKMENELSPRKTMLVLVIVVGCFAVLWPKVFYPMLMGTVNQHIKPSPIDKMTGCCDVISETDINTIKIMNELCGTIIKTKEEKDQKRLNNREIVQICREEVLETCGIDIAAVLQEQVRLGQNIKQILDEVRSLNGSLCLKYNYGIAPWRLGVPHRITIKNDNNIRQERPHHLRSELIHPAFRERGRAIPPQPQQSSKSAPTRPPPRIVDGRPGPIPGMRPTIGGAGHVVPPSKQSTSSMSVIMPIYTIGIVIFFTYTLMKIIFKKQPEGVGGSLYPPVEPDPHFRKEVFESDRSRLQSRVSNGRDSSKSSKLGWAERDARDAELDQLRQRLRETELAMERIVEQMAKVPLKSQDLANGSLSNGDALKPHDNNATDDQPTVKVLGMEMRASCEGGKKWSRPSSPILPTSTTPQPPSEPVPPPQEIYLEGALPAQSHLLVSESATEPQPSASGEDPAVVLAGKMTLSVISLDSSENGNGNKSDEERQKLCEEIDEEIKNLEKQEIEKVSKIESQLENETGTVTVAKEFEVIELKDPIVDTIESVDAKVTPETLQLEELEERQQVQIDKESETSQIPQGIIEVTELEVKPEKPEVIEEPTLKVPTQTTVALDVEKVISDNMVAKEAETKITKTPILETSITKDEEIKNLEKQAIEKVAETESQLENEAGAVPQESGAVAKEFEIIEKMKDPTEFVDAKMTKVAPETLQLEELEKRPKVQIDKESRSEQISQGIIEVTELEVESEKPETVIKEVIEEPTLEVAMKTTVAQTDTKATLQSELNVEKTVADNPIAKETKITETPILEASITETRQSEQEIEENAETIQEIAAEPEKPDKQIDFQLDQNVKEEKEHVENIEKEVDDLINEAVEQAEMIQELKTTAEIADLIEKTSQASSEIGSDEEVEIEEVVYTSNDEEVEEEEVEEDEEEAEEATRQESDVHKRLNGDCGGTEESKQTTTTSHAVAENDISEGTDNEDVDDEEEEIIEIIDDDGDEEEEDNGNIGVNHIAGESGEED